MTVRSCGCSGRRHRMTCVAEPMVPAKCHPDRRHYMNGLCQKCWHSNYKKKNPAPYLRANRTYRLKTRYGVTNEKYHQLEATQNGVCAICKQLCETGKRLAVDHDHTTGRIRGLLCMRCNRGISLFREDPVILQQATHYLQENA